MIDRELPSLITKAMKRLSKRCQVGLLKAGLAEAINNNFHQSIGPLVAEWRTIVSYGVEGKPEYMGTQAWYGCEESVVDFDEIKEAFKGTDFGDFLTSRQTLENGVLKIASGYYNGYTLKHIILKLGLATEHTKHRKDGTEQFCKLTEKGRKFLFESFNTEKQSFKHMDAADITTEPRKPVTETKCVECDFEIDIEWAGKNEGLCQVCLVKSKERP
jgi:hypothetical protein